MTNIMNVINEINETVNHINAVGFEESLSWDIVWTAKKALKELKGTNVPKYIVTRIENLIDGYHQTEEYAWWGTSELSVILVELKKAKHWLYDVPVNTVIKEIKKLFVNNYKEQYWNFGNDKRAQIMVVRARRHSYEIGNTFVLGEYYFKPYFGEKIIVKGSPTDTAETMAKKIADAIENHYLVARAACLTNWISESHRISLLKKIFDAADTSIGKNTYEVYHKGLRFFVTLEIPNIKIKEDNISSTHTIVCTSSIQGIKALKRYINEICTKKDSSARIQIAEEGIALFNKAIKKEDRSFIKKNKNKTAKKIANYLWNDHKLNEAGEYYRKYVPGEDPWEDYGWLPMEPIRKGTVYYALCVKMILDEILQ